jgi:PAS domain S-box-containing protein
MPFSMVLSDPREADNPLVFVNDAFVRETGYSEEEAVGRNCRFLQGPDTNPAHVEAIKSAIGEEREIAVDILNYRKDGTSFINRLLIAPIFSDQDPKELIAYLGIQTAQVEDGDATRADELRLRIQELQHRVKNHLSMVLSLVRLDQRKNSPEEVVANLTRRVASLGSLYDELASAGPASAGVGSDVVPLGAYLSRICATTQDLTDPGRIAVNVDVDLVDVSGQTATQVGMFVSEVLNNSLQHAFDEEENGEVRVRLEDQGETLLVSIADTGRGLGGHDWPQSSSLGGRIVNDMARVLKADMTVDSDDSGTRVTLCVPRKGRIKG